MAAVDQPYVGAKQTLLREDYFRRQKAHTILVSIIGLITVTATVILGLMLHSAHTGYQFQGKWSWLSEGAARLKLVGVACLLAGTQLLAAFLIKITWPSSYRAEFYKKIDFAIRVHQVSMLQEDRFDFYEMAVEDYYVLNPRKIQERLKDNEHLVIILTENGEYQQFVRFEKGDQAFYEVEVNRPTKEKLITNIIEDIDPNKRKRAIFVMAEKIFFS